MNSRFVPRSSLREAGCRLTVLDDAPGTTLGDNGVHGERPRVSAAQQEVALPSHRRVVHRTARTPDRIPTFAYLPLGHTRVALRNDDQMVLEIPTMCSFS